MKVFECFPAFGETSAVRACDALEGDEKLLLIPVTFGTPADEGFAAEEVEGFMMLAEETRRAAKAAVLEDGGLPGGADVAARQAALDGYDVDIADVGATFGVDEKVAAPHVDQVMIEQPSAVLNAFDVELLDDLINLGRLGIGADDVGEDVHLGLESRRAPAFFAQRNQRRRSGLQARTTK